MTRLVWPDSSRPATLDASEVERGMVDALNALTLKEHSLAAVCAVVEDRIGEHLDELMLRQVETVAQSAERRFRLVSQRAFYLDSQAYEVRITEHPTEPTTVQLAVVKIGTAAGTSSPRAPVKLSLNGHGRYSVGMLYVDEDLQSIEDLLASGVQAAFAAGYRWLEAHIIEELLAIEYRLAIELYKEVRSVLPPLLANAVGLYGVSKRDAFYLLDPIAVQTAFARAIERRANVAASPIEVTTLLVTQMLDPDETMSQVSLAEGRRLALKLENSRYASTGLNLVEQMFYDTNELMHCPLVREGKLRITAAYPASMDEQIGPALARIADRCAEIVRIYAKFVFQRAYGQHEKIYTPTLLEGVARLAGFFFGGFTDSQQ
jgi:hypothetical protein